MNLDSLSGLDNTTKIFVSCHFLTTFFTELLSTETIDHQWPQRAAE